MPKSMKGSTVHRWRHEIPHDPDLRVRYTPQKPFQVAGITLPPENGPLDFEEWVWGRT